MDSVNQASVNSIMSAPVEGPPDGTGNQNLTSRNIHLTRTRCYKARPLVEAVQGCLETSLQQSTAMDLGYQSERRRTGEVQQSKALPQVWLYTTNWW